MAPVARERRRSSVANLFLLTVAVAAILAACGGDLPGPEGAATTAAPSSTAPAEPTEPTTTTASTLPLVPTTATTAVDPGIDPPIPVADPGPPPGRNSVFVMGDSVFLGTASSIPSHLPDWVVTYDAQGNRRLAQGIDVLAARRAEIGEAVVVQLGNNYIDGERGDYASQIDEAMTLIGDVPRVVWVTVAEVSPSRVAINEAIRAAGERYPNMFVADWAATMAAEDGLTWDSIHLTPLGRDRMAELIARGLGPVDP